MTTKRNQRIELDQFTRAYIECSLWASLDPLHDTDPENHGENLDDTYSISDLAEETLDKIIEDCLKFQDDNRELLKQCEESNHPIPGSGWIAHAGHDFWLTRNGHGSGFWDGDWPEEIGEKLTEYAEKQGELTIYPGDDDQLYLMQG
jgi:hypothetical protein